MKKLTTLQTALIIAPLFYVSCGSPKPAEPRPSVQVEEESMMSEEIEMEPERLLKSEDLGTYKSRMLGREEYNGPFSDIIDSAVVFAGIPARNIRFYSTQREEFKSAYNPITGIRSIYVNGSYMIDMRNATSKDAIMFVIFHEIGHQLYGHALKPWEKGLMLRPDAELEADQYAGYQMSLRGVPLEECLNALRFFDNGKHSDDYPPFYQRERAATKGFLAAKRLLAQSKN